MGFSKDKEIRFSASSGGIGSSLIKYLFESNKIETAISFTFDNNLILFNPELIYKYSDYKFSGSIYQDINIPHFIKSNVGLIKGPIAVFCLPCQVKSLQHIFQEHGINAYIISLVCSGQLSIEATYYYIKRIGIKKEDILNFQYRGNGWPSGIQIQLKNGDKIYKENWSNPWKEIYSSYLFQPQRCFFCKESISKISDVTIADPWLDQFKLEKIGKTLVLTNTNKGLTLLKDASIEKYIEIEPISEDELLESQIVSVNRKKIYNQNKYLIKPFARLFKRKFYKKIIQSHKILFYIHLKIFNFINKIAYKLYYK